MKPGVDRRLLYAPLAVGALLMLLYAVLWSRAADKMRGTIAAWAEDQRASGIAIDYDDIRTTGFPFFLRGAIGNFSIAAPSWSWRAPQLYVDAQPFGSSRMIFSAPEPHVLRSPSGAEYAIDAKDGRISVEPHADRGWIIDVQSGPGRISGADRSMSAASLLMTLAPAAQDRSVLEASLTARDIMLSDGTHATERAAIDIMVAVTHAAFLADPARWSASGGLIELRRLDIATKTARGSLAGRVAPDSHGRLSGSLVGHFANPGEFALYLDDIGALSPEEARQMSAALSLAAIANGGKLSGSIEIESGEVRLGGALAGAASIQHE